MELVEILKKFKIEEILYFEENYDRQFLALKNLYKNLNNREMFIKLSILNAVNSFKLKMRGEEYWEKFSEFFSVKKSYEYFLEFLKSYNNIFLSIKLRRFKKVKKFLDKEIKSENDIEKLLNLKRFVENLSKTLNQKQTDKTIVFSAKILGYTLRIIGYKIIFPFDIQIPIDYRIGKISKSMEFWKKLSEKCKIPPLHIDSLIWISYNLDIEKIKEGNLKSKIILLKSYLSKYL
ncbi:MAG: N-glycosylase/DNA lyase [Candidatus Aenigmatarchaeota archaeon]